MGLKVLVPPILLDLRNERRSPVHPSWDSAKAAAGTYDEAGLNEFRASRSRSIPDGSLLASTLLGLVTIGRPAISVVDFGGATGEMARDFLFSSPGSNVAVIENPTLVALMRDEGSVRFSSEMPESCDVWFSSGTLQTIEKPYEILKTAFRIARYSVVLAKNCFADVPIYRVQTSRLFWNGAGSIPQGSQDRWVSFPHATLAEPLVLKIAKESGFRMVARIPSTDGVLPYRDQVYGAQMAFIREA